MDYRNVQFLETDQPESEINSDSEIKKINFYH